MNKHDPIYLLACGTAPIPIIERDGLGTISKTTTGTVAARWWIAEEDAARVAAQPHSAYVSIRPCRWPTV